MRPEDKGVLWEHCVLDMLRSFFPEGRLHYWRDRSGRELDFVVRKAARDFTVFECKYDPDTFEADSLTHFREAYPGGENFVVSPAVKSRYRKKMKGMEIVFIPIEDLAGLG